KKTWKLDGKFKEWYNNGQISKEIDYRNWKFDGQLLTYWENGHLKRRDNYESGKFVDGKCFDSAGNEIKYFPYEIRPQFPGGEQVLFSYISRMLRYPVYAQEHRITGRVVVNFYVEKDGRIDNLTIVRSVSPELDSEALRVIISMPNWTPGLQDGNPVRVLYTLPISFKIK
ncbi:MAG: TonB family protein, partial [Paludibacter sp.]